MSTKPVAKTHPARVGHAVQTVLVWIMAVIFLAPLYFVVLNSFKTKGEISVSATTLPTFLNLENYARILEDDYFVSSFLTSVAMVVVVTSLTCLVAAMAGYALARWKSKLSTGLNLAIMSTLFVPFQVYMVAMIIVVRPSLSLSKAFCILCSVTVSSALVASSSMSIFGFLSKTRAMDMRCFCPPESITPRSPI